MTYHERIVALVEQIIAQKSDAGKRPLAEELYRLLDEEKEEL